MSVGGATSGMLDADNFYLISFQLAIGLWILLTQQVARAVEECEITGTQGVQAVERQCSVRIYLV